MRQNRTVLMTAIASLASFGSLAAHAAGIVTLDFDGNTPEDIHAFRIGSDGRILADVDIDGACGYFALDANGVLMSGFGTGGRLARGACGWDLRIRPDGTLYLLSGGGIQQRDASGAVISTTASLFPPSPPTRFPRIIKEQPDGKYIVAGSAKTCGACTDWLLGRFNADGTPDLSFNGGPFILSQGVGLYTVLDVQILSSGKVLVSGNGNPGGGPVGTVLQRFNSDGTTDTSFGAAGRVVVHEGPGSIGLDSTGRIYIPAEDGTVTRLDSNGTVDGAYVVATPPAPPLTPIIGSLAVDSADRVILFGQVGTGANGKAYVGRLDNTGAADTTFNGTGEVLVSFPNGLSQSTSERACAGAMQANSPVIACSVAGMSRTDLAIARLTTAGALDSTFAVGQPDSDYYPDAFSFPDVTVPYGSANVVSAPITISGLNMPTSIGSTPGDISIGCNGTFSRPAKVFNGDIVCIRQDASLQPGATKTGALSVGGRSATFTVISSNTPADTTPDAFAFTDQTNVALDGTVTSNTITIQGIGGRAPLTITGGSYSINCSPDNFVTSATTVTNGTTVCVRHTASASPATTASTTLTVSGVSDTFTSTTVPADMTPDAFSFTSQTGVGLGALVVSNPVTIAGINTATAISISGGEYSIACSGTFTAAAGTIQPNQSVCVRQTASSNANTATNTTLTVGGFSSVFTSTTGAGNSNGGGGGAMNALELLLLAAMGLFGWRVGLQRKTVDEKNPDHRQRSNNLCSA